MTEKFHELHFLMNASTTINEIQVVLKNLVLLPPSDSLAKALILNASEASETRFGECFKIAERDHYSMSCCSN